MTWRETRQDLLFDSIRDGTTANIEEIIINAEQEYNEQKGRDVESRVVEALSTIPIVHSANLGNEQDDRALNDVLVTFQDKSGHLPIVIQVKTSWEGVDKYKDQVKNGHEDDRRIFLKVDPDMSNRSIIRIFLSKVKEIDGYI